MEACIWEMLCLQCYFSYGVSVLYVSRLFLEVNEMVT